MKALFLAGGKGVRLQPLTDDMPKPMVPIMNRPLLERTMINLKKSGVTEIVISSCYKANYIKNYFGAGEALGLKINYIVEDFPLGTGGAIKKAGAGFDETFLVFNSDILSDISIPEMIALHKSSNALVTIATTEVENPSAYGVIESDKNGLATSFVEKPAPDAVVSKFINAGIYIFEPEVLNEIPDESIVSVERHTFPLLLEKGGRIAVYKSDCYWMDIGTIGKYVQAHMDVMNGKCDLIESGFSANQVHIGKNVQIHPGSKIKGPVYIGDNVTIADKTYLHESVIGNNASIGTGSTVIGSVIWNGVQVGNNEDVLNTVLTKTPSAPPKTPFFKLPKADPRYGSQRNYS